MAKGRPKGSKNKSKEDLVDIAMSHPGYSSVRITQEQMDAMSKNIVSGSDGFDPDDFSTTLHVRVKYKVLDETVKKPEYAHEGDAAFDIYNHHFVGWYDRNNNYHNLEGLDLEEFALPPQGRLHIGTGIFLDLIPPTGADLLIRSGVSFKYGIAAINGIGLIDNPYRGDVGIRIINLSRQPYIAKIGERIAQLRLFSQIEGHLTLVEEVSESDRGTNGYGSSGIN